MLIHRSLATIGIRNDFIKKCQIARFHDPFAYRRHQPEGIIRASIFQAMDKLRSTGGRDNGGQLGRGYGRGFGFKYQRIK